MRRILYGVAGALATAALVAGCGGGGGGTSSYAKPAPAASLFPPAKGQQLPAILAKAAPSGDAGPVVLPNAQVFSIGKNRVSFGVFTVDRKQVIDAPIALYAAHGPKGKTIGPYPAQIEDLTTEKRFEAQTTANDPAAAKVVYSTTIPFTATGEWRLGAIVKVGKQLRSTLLPSINVKRRSPVPAVGQRAPLIHTPTVKSVGGAIAKIDTRVPPDDMHDADYANFIGRKPIVLVFATPQLCKSRVCGPIVDEALQVKQALGKQAVFIHQEVYNDNNASKGLRPQLVTFHLPSEPWVFAIDRKGIIRARFEGAVGVPEITAGVKAAIAGKNLAP